MHLTGEVGGTVATGDLWPWSSTTTGTLKLDIAWRRDLYPERAKLGRLPVVGDGCGNYYVLPEDGTVGFIDTVKDPGPSTVKSRATCCRS